MAGKAQDAACVTCGCPQEDHPGFLAIGPCDEYRSAASIVNYDGPDESVECAYPPCTNRLRRSDFPGPQWCSKAHREASSAAESRGCVAHVWGDGLFATEPCIECGSLPRAAVIRGFGLIVSPLPHLTEDRVLYAEVVPAGSRWLPLPWRWARWWFEVHAVHAPDEHGVDTTTYACVDGGSGGGFTLRSCIAKATDAVSRFTEEAS